MLVPVLWRQNLAWNTVVIITAVLIVAGFIGTYPKFFELFASD